MTYDEHRGGVAIFHPRELPSGKGVAFVRDESPDRGVVSRYIHNDNYVVMYDPRLYDDLYL